VSEASTTTLSCGGAVIGWLVVLSGTIAIPFTAGASTVVTAIGYTAPRPAPCRAWSVGSARATKSSTRR